MVAATERVKLQVGRWLCALRWSFAACCFACAIYAARGIIFSCVRKSCLDAHVFGASAGVCNQPARAPRKTVKRAQGGGGEGGMLLLEMLLGYL
jgi:hypothetical protein